MTAAPVTIGPELTLAETAKIMSEKGIRHLPVVDKGDLVGMLSERDVNVVRCLHTVTLETVTAGQIMHEAPFATGPETPLEDVAGHMAERRIGSAVIVKDEQVIGIFTTVDGLRALRLMCSLGAASEMRSVRLARPAPESRAAGEQGSCK